MRDERETLRKYTASDLARSHSLYQGLENPEEVATALVGNRSFHIQNLRALRKLRFRLCLVIVLSVCRYKLYINIEGLKFRGCGQITNLGNIAERK